MLFRNWTVPSWMVSIDRLKFGFPLLATDSCPYSTFSFSFWKTSTSSTGTFCALSIYSFLPATSYCIFYLIRTCCLCRGEGIALAGSTSAFSTTKPLASPNCFHISAHVSYFYFLAWSYLAFSNSYSSTVSSNMIGS